VLRTVFFGTSAFAVPALDVAADRSSVLGVVTQPDRPAGRGQRLRPSPVKSAALERSLPIYEPRSLRDFAGELRGLEIDCFVVASYGRILPASLLSLPALGALGIHPSLLPRHRGATPIQAALLAGDRQTGVTIVLMDAGMDTGEIVLQERLAIAPDEVFGTLHDRLAHLGARLLAEALQLGERDAVVPHEPQRGDASTTRPIDRADLEVVWEWPAAQIVNHVRAYSPQPAARATLAETRVKILKARDFRSLPRQARDDEVGSILGTDAEAVLVTCGDGVVAVGELIAPSHKRETGAAFARRVGAP
jgi:methionyl-tRNA formyltransferase